MAEEQRIPIASFYLDGPALSWYQWMFYNNQLTSWTNFLHALQLRFGPLQFDDLEGALFKLTQTIYNFRKTKLSSNLLQPESLAFHLIFSLTVLPLD